MAQVDEVHVFLASLPDTLRIQVRDRLAQLIGEVVGDNGLEVAVGDQARPFEKLNLIVVRIIGAVDHVLDVNERMTLEVTLEMSWALPTQRGCFNLLGLITEGLRQKLEIGENKDLKGLRSEGVVGRDNLPPHISDLTWHPDGSDVVEGETREGTAFQLRKAMTIKVSDVLVGES